MWDYSPKSTKWDHITAIILKNNMLIRINSGNSNVFKVIVQEVLLRDKFSVIVQEVLRGILS